jgi:hypothetical protein
MRLTTKWRNGIRMVDGVRWMLGSDLLYRHDPREDGETWSIVPASYTSTKQRQAWADRLFLADAKKALRRAQRLVKELER